MYLVLIPQLHRQQQTAHYMKMKITKLPIFIFTLHMIFQIKTFTIKLNNQTYAAMMIKSVNTFIATSAVFAKFTHLIGKGELISHEYKIHANHILLIVEVVWG